ncbi:MAG: apolipoprotein N-acyltransferase [Pseudomonadales bacterium]
MNTLSQGWRGHFLALVAGALVTPSLAPFNIWPLGIASVALLVWLLADLSPVQAAKRGWFYGFALFGTGSSWIYVSIHVYGYAPVPLAAFLTLLWSIGLGLLTSVTAYIYVRWLRDCLTGHAGGQHLGFAAIFVLGEWLRSWLLTGFPWLYLGYAHIDTALAGWAPVGGVFSLSFIVAVSGAVIANSLMQRKIIASQLSLVLVLWLGGAILQTIDWVTPASKAPVQVAMVQANIAQDIKWNRDQYWPTLTLYQQTSQPLWEHNDIVIWPEAAIPGYYQNAKEFLERVGQQAKAHNASLITGIPYLYPATDSTALRYHNSIMGFGEGSGIYHKQRLVPFGEFVPLEGLLRGLIQFFNLPMSAFSAGPPAQAAIKAGDLTLAPFICYEIVYPELVNEWLPEADLLITISNDAWFGESIGPLQHLQMAQMRALESGRYLLRATGSGVSAIVDQRGHIVVRGDQFKREVIQGEAIIYRGATPFALAGSWPILLLCFAICISLRAIAVKMRG